MLQLQTIYSKLQMQRTSCS